MAIAKKCDICGKLYEEYNVRQSKDNFNGFMLLNIDRNEDYFHGQPYDCCPECMNSIMEHIKILEKLEKKEK